MYIALSPLTFRFHDLKTVKRRAHIICVYTERERDRDRDRERQRERETERERRIIKYDPKSVSFRTTTK